ELVSLSDHLRLTTIDVGADVGAATRYDVAAVPTVIIRRRNVADGEPGAARPGESAGSGQDGPEAVTTAAKLGANVRFLGLPGGYEFSTLIADIVDVSKGHTDLSEAARQVVQAIESPVHIQVFVTPT